MQYAWGGNVGMQMIKEVADNIAGHRGVIVNSRAAQQLGIADGDPIEISTPRRSVTGRAVLRQGIRPDTLLLLGQFDHWETPLARDFGMPSLNSLATMSIALTDATGSGADIVRVALHRLGEGGYAGRAPGRPKPAARWRDSSTGRATSALAPSGDRPMYPSDEGSS